MELPVLSRPFANRKLSLPSELHVSPSDFPEAVQIETLSDGVVISFDYFINEPAKSRTTTEGDGFSIIYGKGTGRIYTIHLDGLTKKKSLLDALNGLKNYYEDIRMQLNFTLGIKISSRVYDLIKERL